MRRFNKKRLFVMIAIMVALILFASVAFAADGEAEEVSPMANSFWALVPAIVAIAMALITKEVYSSLFIGIVVGALFVANFNIEKTLNVIVVDGLVGSLSDGWNVGILIFLVLLGIIVALINKAGGSAAYGEHAKTSIKSKKGALLSTFGLGCLIFVDDYFNCLTVGSVMLPVTDGHKISRAKLAYIIDATAAPICMIAPISSWAAAVSGLVEGTNGLTLFCQAIPYNFYSLLTIVFIIVITLMKIDFGPMKKHEENAEKGDLYTTEHRPFKEDNDEDKAAHKRARTYDLAVPIIILIASCVIGMVYTGGFFAGENFIDAFANSDASVGLSLGSLVALIIILIYYRCRRTLSFKDEMACIPKGFIAMVPAILILTFAWTLSGMTSSLGAADFVAGLVSGSAAGLVNMLPAIIFLVAIGLSFATGTSWGTFGILIPIVVAIFPAGSELQIIGISACLAGSVCGDHCSPISDTTIMASTGARCYHINHVSTQLPYALTVAAVAFVGFVIAGFVQNVFITLPISIAIMVAVLFLIKWRTGRKTVNA